MGQVVERYEVERLLGEGAMAAVYLVRHTKLGSEHALKLLTLGRSRQIRSRMLQEGRTQAHLEHPNIARVFDAFEIDGMPALLLEYVGGPTLEDHLGGKALPVDEAERIFRQIVAGVHAAHNRDVVHRDLKPANILLQPSDAGLIPKVADFGIAKALSDDKAGQTRAGTAMGTPRYMAPEQATDAKDVDHRADVFALGCILYEMVCGKPAFEGENLPTIFNAVLAGDYAPPNEVNPDVPPRIRATIEGCLKTERDERLPDCPAILSCLDDGGVTEEVARPVESSEPAPSTPPIAVPAGGAPWLVLAAAVLVIGLGTAGVLALGSFAYWMGSGEPAVDEPVPGELVDGPCPGPRGEVVGWAWAGSAIDVPEGEVWVVDTDRNVRADYPRKDNDFDARADVVCVLRKGTKLRIDAPIERPPGAVWVPVVAGSVE